MAEVWGGILRGIGQMLSGIYSVVPSYVVAIILLTVLVRVLLIPLTVKQIRSMNAMQRIQPELKRLQTLHKGDRQKLNEELMKVYKEHGVNPLGGCFPLLMQAPVFIALFSVLRAAVPVAVAVEVPAGQPIPQGDDVVICQPVGDPSVRGAGPDEIACEMQSGETLRFQITAATSAGGQTAVPPFITVCDPRPGNEENPGDFVCLSPVGTGHLPKDGDLFEDIIEGRSGIGGMEMACSPTDASSEQKIRRCAPKGAAAGFANAIPYYLLVAMMVGTTWYQQKQMSKRAQGPQAAQMQMMARIMPLFLGVISISIPAGVIIYWVVSNGWTIGQQSVFLKKQDGALQSPNGSAKPKKVIEGKAVEPKSDGKGKAQAKGQALARGPSPQDGGGRPGQAGRKRKSKKRKR